MKMSSYRDILLNDLESRRGRNPHYTLRAFARDLNVNPSRLSEVLNNKKGLSFAAAEDICSRLELSEKDHKIFLLSTVALHSRSKVERKKAQTKLNDLLLLQNKSIKKTTTITNWITEVILKLSKRENKEFTKASLSKELGVPQFQVESSLRYLVRLGFLKTTDASKSFLKDKDKYSRLNVDYQQLLDLAADNNLSRSVNPINFSHTPLLINKSKIDDAEEIILQCIEDLKKLEDTGSTSDFYYFNTQLFNPLFSPLKKEKH